jgi:eukaryotic-like serine/threonine-protein kinase
VWVQPNGGAQVLDMAWGHEPAAKEPETVVPAEATGAAAQQRALALLGRTAALALEGVPRSASSTEAVRAPLPRHAAELLTRLLAGRGSCRKFRAALRATHDQPAEVSRARRAGHLAVLAALLFVGAGCCMFPAGWLVEAMPGIMRPAFIMEGEKSLKNLDHGAWLEFATSSAGTGPACWPALGQLHADLTLREQLQEKIESDWRRANDQLDLLSPLARQQAVVIQKSTRDQSALMENNPTLQQLEQHRRREHRMFARHALTSTESLSEVEAVLRGITLAPLLAWPALWVAWAFLLRGGLSYHIVGIDLVCADGRPARRWQCAWRALLVWAPVTGLLVLSWWLQIRFWSDWDHGDRHLWQHTLATALWYAAVALLVIYVVLAIARPTRAFHDRLAGTYLVPR